MIMNKNINNNNMSDKTVIRIIPAYKRAKLIKKINDIQISVTESS